MSRSARGMYGPSGVPGARMTSARVVSAMIAPPARTITRFGVGSIVVGGAGVGVGCPFRFPWCTRLRSRSRRGRSPLHEGREIGRGHPAGDVVEGALVLGLVGGAG